MCTKECVNLRLLVLSSRVEIESGSQRAAENL